MKCILLCGGFAKRLWPITLYEAKPLLKINGHHVIDYLINKLDIQEIDEIIVSTNQRFAHDFEKWIDAQAKKKKITLAVEPATNEGEKFGVMKALNFLVQKYNIKSDVLVIGADNLFDFSIKDFLKFYHEKRALCVAVHDVKNREEAKIYGVMDVDANDMLIKFTEKPAEPTSTLISTCCYVFPKDVLSFFDVYIKEGHPKDNPGSFIQWFFQRNPIYAYAFNGNWFDIGTKDVMKRAEDWVKKDGVVP